MLATLGGMTSTNDKSNRLLAMPSFVRANVCADIGAATGPGAASTA